MERFCQLLVQRPGSPDQVFTLATDAATVGRAEINDIVLPYAGADQGSANGTWVNGVRVARALLSPGDTVQVGESTLRFDIPPPAESGNNAAAHAAEVLSPDTGSGTLQM